MKKTTKNVLGIILMVLLIVLVLYGVVNSIQNSQKPDLTIQAVISEQGSYTIIIKNIGKGDINTIFYLCIWDDEYRSRKPGCNSISSVNYDLKNQSAIPLKFGDIFILRGIYYGDVDKLQQGKIYFAIDITNPVDPLKKEDNNNEVSESNEYNNLYVYDTSKIKGISA